MPLSRSQRAADAVTWFCGTWTIIFIATAFIAVWVALNIFAWWQHWDPYPFILLNLFFTVVEFYQGPLIMMSQNREQERDREAWREMNEKLDELLGTSRS